MSTTRTHFAPTGQPSATIARTCLALCTCGMMLWIISVCWLSLTSTPPKITGVLGWDKLQHALAYGFLALLATPILIRVRGTASGNWWRVWILTVFLGGLLEILQMTAGAGRTGEWGDLIANALGAWVICILLQISTARFLRGSRLQFVVLLVGGKPGCDS